MAARDAAGRPEGRGPAVATARAGRVQALLTGLGGAPFLRAAGVLQAGSLGLSAIGFLASVLLARALGPTAYGVYALVMSIGTLIGLLRRLGQDYAATSRLAEGYAAGRSRPVRDALVFYVCLSVASSALVLPPAILLAPRIAEHFVGDAELGALLQLYLVQGFWAVVSGVTVIVLQASRRMGALVGFETVSTLATSLLPLAAALAGFGVFGVFYGQVAASLLAAGLGLALYARLQAGDALLPPLGELLRSVARPGIALWRETRFGLSIAADKNVVSLYNLAPILLLGVVAPESEVGELRVALTYMAIPAVLLSPVSRLLMVDVPRLRVSAPEQVRPFFLRVTLLGALASALLALPFAAGAGVLVPLLYGQAYDGAAPLSLALVVDAASLGLGIAAGPLFRAYDRTDLPLRTNLVILVVAIPLALVAVQTFGALGAALAYAGTVFASRALSYVQCLQLLQRARPAQRNPSGCYPGSSPAAGDPR